MNEELESALALDPDRKRALLAALLRERGRRVVPPEPMPLSLAQRRLWLLERIEPGTGTYNVPLAFGLRGKLDIAALQRALNEIVGRHDVLRTVVTEVDGEPVGRVDPAFVLALPVSDLDGAETLTGLLERESALPFDLEARPAIRALLVRCSADEHVLLVTFHHIAVDGWSVGIFKRELATLYSAYARAVVPVLPTLRSSYAKFSVRQRERVAGNVLERGLAFWREHLRDAPPAIDFPSHGDGRNAGGRTRTRVIDRATSDALAAFSRTHRSTLFSTLLTLVFVLLQRYTGQRDLVVGCATANRGRSEDETLIGFFVNTLPLRVRMGDDRFFSQLLSDVHAMTLAALDHAEIPFVRLVEELNPARIAGQTPLVNVMFVLQLAEDDMLVLDGLDVTPIAVDTGSAKFDLTIQCVESVDGLRASIEYRTSRFDETTIDGMLEAFETLTAAVVRDADALVSHLPLVNARGRQAQLAVLERTARRQLSGGRLETLFEMHAQSRPDGLALVCGTERVSYGELNERANRLAHHLVAIGVATGAAVGICLDRGTSAIIAMLAILKAGGTYVPLDPDYPPERLAFMLADSGTRLVITQRRVADRVGAAAEIVALDDSALWEACARTNPGVAGSGDDAATPIPSPASQRASHRGRSSTSTALPKQRYLRRTLRSTCAAIFRRRSRSAGRPPTPRSSSSMNTCSLYRRARAGNCSSEARVSRWATSPIPN